MLRVLIVDDEAPARRALQQALRGRDEVSEVLECGDGRTAVRLLRSQGFEVLYLDVRMPDVDGREVLRRVADHWTGVVVFVTAHAEFAVEAFDVSAVDYLLKPFTRERFEDSFQRVVRAVEAGGVEAPARHRLRITTSGRTVLVDADEILWIEAANTYVRVHTRRATHLLRSSMGALEQELQPIGFFRVHRSALVRLAVVRELRPAECGDSELELTNGDIVPVSRRRRVELARTLQRGDATGP